MKAEKAAGAAGHSPNHLMMATRKLCQNHEYLDRFDPLTSPKPSHISENRATSHIIVAFGLL
jgi:hypothetical protein